LPPDNARCSRAAIKRYPVELETLNALNLTSANRENPMRHCSTQNRLADLLLKNQEISPLVAQLRGGLIAMQTFWYTIRFNLEKL
jgi:hypothetical protein